MNPSSFLVNDDHFFPHLVKLRRAIHQYPELSYKEIKTSQLVCKELDELQIPYIKIAGTGIRAVIKGEEKQESGKTDCIGLRADMDALPVYEKTNLSFKSKNDGIMHACGHDGHVAMLLGAARLLKKTKFSGTIVLLFQPAEEAGNGAARMIEENALDGVKMIFGGHIDTHFQTGYFKVDSGLICSYADPFVIKIHGRGGHAARPHEAIDSVVLASNLVVNMQTLVSRGINPSHAAVVTVGRMEAGTVLNAIAEEAVLEGTIRSAHLQTRKKLRKGLHRLIQGVREMSNANIELDFNEHLPAVVNDETAASIAREAAVELLGEQKVLNQSAPSLGGEDFAFYQQEIPGCLIRFGAQVEGDRVGPAHSGHYDFDEKVMKHGASWLAHVAIKGLDYLNKEKE